MRTSFLSTAVKKKKQLLKMMKSCDSWCPINSCGGCCDSWCPINSCGGWPTAVTAGVLSTAVEDGQQLFVPQRIKSSLEI